MRILVLLLLLPLTSASTVHEDPAGDVEVRLAEQPAGDPAGRFDHVDLRALEVEEGRLDVVFRLHVSSLPPDGTTLIDDAIYWILFSHGEEDYGTRIRRGLETAGGIQYGATLHPITDDMAGHATILENNVDPAGSIEVSVPRQLIPDGTGAPPRPGTALTGLEVLSFGVGILFINNDSSVHGEGNQAAIRTLDRMPDSGPGGEVPFVVGVQQEGDLELRSLAPVRVSNGGSGVFIFEVIARNHGSQPMNAHLHTSGGPEAWSVLLPFEEALVLPGEDHSFPIMLTLQSGHRHGGLEQMAIELLGDEGHAGRVEVGIQYTTVPQPAGHHDRLWLHTRQAPPFLFDLVWQATGQEMRRSLYMNTLEEDPADTGQAIPGGGISFPALPGNFSWLVPLAPALAMGLHMDPTRTGELMVPMEYDYIGEDLRLGGHLRVRGDDDHVIAQIRSDGGQDITAGSAELTAAIEVADGVERIPFHDDQQLEMVLTLSGTFNGPTVFTPNYAPRVAPGGWLQLPLLEYQDNPQSFADAFDGLRLSLDASHREANPGDVVLVQGMLENRLGQDLDLRIEVDGIHAEWGTLRQASAAVKADGSAPLALRIDVPEDAVAGMAADIAITAHDAEDPFRRTVARFTLDVVDEPVEDDSDALADWGMEAKKSPVPVAAAMVGLACALWRRRGH